MLTVSRTYLEMPVIIHELSTAPVPADQLDEPVQASREGQAGGGMCYV